MKLKTPLLISKSCIRYDVLTLLEECRVLGSTSRELVSRYRDEIASRIAAPALQDYAEGVIDMVVHNTRINLCEQRFTLVDGQVISLTEWAGSLRERTAGCTYSVYWKGTDAAFDGPYSAS